MSETKPCFEDLKEGESLPPMTMLEAVGRMDWVSYAGASGDFNPMHTDEAAAKDVGLPSVFGHGMFTAGVLATALTNRFGIGRLASYKVRFVKQVWPGEAMIVSQRVVRKYVEGDKHLADLECQVTNQRGEVSVSGEATVMLDARG